MSGKWVINNMAIEGLQNIQVGNFCLSVTKDNSFQIFEEKSVTFLIDGYILPKNAHYLEFRGLNQTGLLARLVSEHGPGFIDFIKGMFTIVLFYNYNIYVFNDHHSLKKFFIYKKGFDFIVSNRLKLISEKFSLTPSNENIAIFCLLEHFVDGMTLFEEVTYSKPATKLIIEPDGTLKIDKYWNPIELLNRKIKDYSYDEIAQSWRDTIKGYLDFLNPKEITMTLTGGNDSRMVVAGLISNEVKPNAFTFGNPKSADGVVAKEIADKVSLNYNNYFVDKPTSKWFKTYSNKILQVGNSVINIHRAHRLDAVEKEIQTNKNSEMLFTGLVGGEYLKEPRYNSITIPKLYLEFGKLNKKSKKKDLIESRLSENGIITDKLDLEYIIKRLDSAISSDSSLSIKQQKFIHTFNYYASVHHTQDPHLFNMHFKYVINPFMDIDFLYKVADSKFWYPNKYTTILSKPNHSYLLVKITDILDSRLSQIMYAKRGFYTGEELLRQPFFHIFKRIYRIIRKSNSNYKQNFPIGNWLYDYCKSEIKEIHPSISRFYPAAFLKEQLEKVKDKSNEEPWHIVTNPINISLNLKYYENV